MNISDGKLVTQITFFHQISETTATMAIIMMKHDTADTPIAIDDVLPSRKQESIIPVCTYTSILCTDVYCKDTRTKKTRPSELGMQAHGVDVYNIMRSS